MYNPEPGKDQKPWANQRQRTNLGTEGADRGIHVKPLLPLQNPGQIEESEAISQTQIERAFQLLPREQGRYHLTWSSASSSSRSSPVAMGMTSSTLAGLSPAAHPSDHRHSISAGRRQGIERSGLVRRWKAAGAAESGDRRGERGGAGCRGGGRRRGPGGNGGSPAQGGG